MLKPALHQIELTRTVHDVFGTMLGIEVAPCSGPRVGPGGYHAALQFVGDWNGALLLACEEEQARAFAVKLMPNAAITVDDICDALGELVNMVGGNLKAVLPAGVTLSLPTVVAGNDFAMHICGAGAFERQTFTGEAGLLEVMLIQIPKGPSE